MGQFNRSYDVQQLVERICRMKVGDSIPLAELCETINGGSVDGATFRGKLASARRGAQRDKQIVTTVNERKLIRLDDAAIVTTGQSSIARIRRESRRGMQRLACVDYAALSEVDRRKHDTAATHLGVLAEFSRPRTVERIAAAVNAKQDKLELDATLRAFRGEAGDGSK